MNKEASYYFGVFWGLVIAAVLALLWPAATWGVVLTGAYCLLRWFWAIYREAKKEVEAEMKVHTAHFENDGSLVLGPGTDSTEIKRLRRALNAAYARAHLRKED